MVCFILRTIYNIFPLTYLRAKIIDNHFLTCKRCRKEFEIKEISINKDIFQKIDLWPQIYQRLTLKEETKKVIKVFKWAFALSIIIVSIGLGLVIYQNRKGNLNQGWEKREGNPIVENAYFRGEKAKVYIFKTKEPDISIIWLEPNREYNYK